MAGRRENMENTVKISCQKNMILGGNKMNTVLLRIYLYRKFILDSYSSGLDGRKIREDFSFGDQ